MKEINFKEIEDKWNEKWYKENIFTSDPSNKEKFFVIFAYPGISGYLHVGHFRGYTYADIIARYKRAKGFNVLFPVGFHASGLPSIGLAKKVERGDEKTIEYLRRNKTPEEIIPKLKDPLFVVEYFSKVYIDYFKKFGYSIDFRRTCSTIQKGYNKFIQWQFRKLYENGYLIQKEHYAPYSLAIGPVAVDPSETDLSKGGDAQQVIFTLVEFQLEDSNEIFPAATLRSETIFGVTNLYVNPSGKYVKVKYNNKVYIVSHLTYYKFLHQFGNTELIEEVDISKYIGKKVINPITKDSILILPGDFVNVNIGTGVVMSVPAHDCHDYLMLKRLKENCEEIEKKYGIKREELLGIKEKVIINLPNRKFPAKEIIEEFGINSIDEKEKLEKAKQKLYGEEYHHGILNENCLNFKGKSVNEAREEIDKLFLKLYDFNKEVIDRVGSPVIIKKIPNQWFIKYSDEEVKRKSKEHVKRMKIVPESFKRDLIEHIIDWYDDRAACRQGNWLGTEFPFEKGWIIEPISDSTIYPSFYIIAKYINNGTIKEELLNDEFFDYVFLGIGDPSEIAKKLNVNKEVIEEIRKEFEYYYPLNLNIGGKEHRTVHFPVFIFNHIMIFPEKYWPKGILVNWWVLGKYGKISKSKGGAQPIPDLQEKYGIDAIRLYYSNVGKVDTDIVFDEEIALKYKSKLHEIFSLIKGLIENIENFEENEKLNILDKWLIYKLNEGIINATNFMEDYDIRSYSQEVYFNLIEALKDYLSIGKGNKKVIIEFIENLIKLFQPITPHVAEELWSYLGKNSFVSLERFPEGKIVYEEFKYVEKIMKRLIEDLNNLSKLAKGEKMKIVIASDWKYELFERLKGKNFKEQVEILRSYMEKDKELISKLLKKIKKGLWEFMDKQFEKELLEEIADFLKRKYNMSVEIVDEENCKEEKAKLALPGKFSIIFE